MASRKVCIEPTPDTAVSLAATLFKTIVCDAVDKRGVCHIALAGGTTPQPLYQALAASGMGNEVPWNQADVFFSDERNVPLDHVESNYRLAQRIMLDHLPIEPNHIYPIRGDADDLDAAAREYEETIRRIVHVEGDLPRFDLILLGMGGDGHAASLFPGTKALDETQRLVVANYVPVLDRMRLTFTYPLINAARNVMMLVLGDDKVEAIGIYMSPDPAVRSKIPAGRVNPTDGLLTLVTDSAAYRLASGT